MQEDLRRDMQAQAVEPLLPIERKLIGWSLGVGIVLLLVLVTVTRVLAA